MGILRTVYELFPPPARVRIKALLGSEGHKSSWMDTLKARDHARGKKRLDVIAEAMAAKLRAAGISSLRDRRCLEFGAGNMPSEVMVFSLLGADRIAATDYNAIARLDLLGEAARAADPARVIAALAPLADGLDLEARLDALRKRGLPEPVQYQAPHDMSVAPLEARFDFINSTSVLEHLPPALAKIIVTNVAACLARGGEMIHEVDLQDHLDFAAPLAFLARGNGYDPARDFDARGNRLRRGDWLALFGEIPSVTTRLVFERIVEAEKIPPDLAPPWSQLTADELRVTWIGLHSRTVG